MDIDELIRTGHVREAIGLLQDHLRANPDDVEALMKIAAIAAERRAVPEALSALRRVVALVPRHGHAWLGIADLEAARGNAVEADACYRRAGSLLPDEPAVPYNHGALLAQQGDSERALAAYQEAIRRRPDFAMACNNIGSLLMNQGNLDQAAAYFNRALEIDAGLTESNYNLGLVAEQTGKAAAAANYFRKVLLQDRQHYGALVGLARAFSEVDTASASDAMALCDAAIALQPDRSDAYHAKGVILDREKRHISAADAYQVAWIKSSQSMLSALKNRATSLHKGGAYRQSLDAMEELLTHEAPDAGRRLAMINLRQHLCEWGSLGEDVSALRESIARNEITEDCSAFFALSVPGVSEAEIYRLSVDFAAAQAAKFKPSNQASGPSHEARASGPLKIGYLSADLHEHATAYLLAGVLEKHSRENVEVIAYSYGPDNDSLMRRRLVAACDRFREISRLSDAAAADAIREDGIHILVDLKGWTAHARPEILLHEPAPVKVNWLGYPGTMGQAVYADYLIGDPIATPPESSAFFSETLALMPHCYQPNDDRRPLGAQPSRAELGLPEDGTVFCSFNQSYKISPDVFDVWCRLLREVSGSVLWLLAPPTEAQENLRSEAAARGVDTERLIFAQKLPVEAHLGRLQVADIALDTSPYNSHTTASDALWAGVPLVCFRGDRFAGRVAASIVSAAGVPELAGDSLEDYFHIAYSLATRPERLQALKTRIQPLRRNCPLFDTAGFTHDLEELYQRMWSDHQEGKKRILLPVGQRKGDCPVPVGPAVA